MRRIAAEVGVQVGALYNYTPDKQTLLFALMDEHMRSLLAAWEDEPRGDTPEARLEAFARFHIRFNLERAEAVFISYMELRNLTLENFGVIEARRRTYETALEEILRDGLAAGIFQMEDPKVASLAIIAMLTGVNTWYRAGGRLSLEEVQTLYCGMIRQMTCGALPGEAAA